MFGRSGFMMLIAIVCGLAAMYGRAQMMAKETKEIPTREVLVAARDVKVEEVLQPDMVKVVRIPVPQVPAGSFASYKDVAERWARIPLLANDPILDAKLAPKGRRWDSCHEFRTACGPSRSRSTSNPACPDSSCPSTGSMSSWP